MVDTPLFYRILHIPGGARFLLSTVRFCFKSTVCLFIVEDSPEGGFSGNIVKQNSQRKKHWEQLFWNSGKTPNKMFRWGFGAPAQCQKNSIISEWKNIRINFHLKKKNENTTTPKIVIFFRKKWNSWRFCWWPFWGFKETLSKAVSWPPNPELAHVRRAPSGGRAEKRTGRRPGDATGW